MNVTSKDTTALTFASTLTALTTASVLPAGSCEKTPGPANHRAILAPRITVARTHASRTTVKSAVAVRKDTSCRTTRGPARMWTSARKDPTRAVTRV